MPSRWAPSRRAVSKTWKPSPSGVPAGVVLLNGLLLARGRLVVAQKSKKTPCECKRSARRVPSGALPGALRNDDHGVESHTGMLPHLGRTDQASDQTSHHS